MRMPRKIFNAILLIIMYPQDYQKQFAYTIIALLYVFSTGEDEELRDEEIGRLKDADIRK